MCLVLEPRLLTALGARPGAAPFPSPQQAACRGRDPESQAEQGASGIPDAGEGPCGHHSLSPNVLPDLTEQLELGRDTCVNSSHRSTVRRPLVGPLTSSPDQERTEAQLAGGGAGPALGRLRGAGAWGRWTAQQSFNPCAASLDSVTSVTKQEQNYLLGHKEQKHRQGDTVTQ